MSNVTPYSGYSIFKNAAFATKTGTVNDSIGQVLFIFKSKPFIKTTNQSATEIDGGTNQLISFGRGEATSIDCFYNLLMQKSKYDYEWLKHNQKKDDANKKILENSINIFKVQIDSNKRVLDVRIKDPMYIIGVEIVPEVPFFSIAYSLQEKTSLSLLINDTNNFITGTKVFFTYDATIQPTTVQDHRPYYEFELKLTGSKKDSGGNIIENTINTGITVRSVDGSNFFSDSYATAAFPLITGETWNNYIWDNAIIPETTASTTNPFNTNWSTLKSNLTTIISEADNLPTAGTNKGKQLLNNEIRDAIYKGDIEQVTFEMAFRLPFYTVDVANTPYVNDNNPYYSKFQSWFDYANTVRNTFGLMNDSNLSRTGFTTGFTNLIINDPKHLKLYEVFGIVRNTSLNNHDIPAYFASLLNDENKHNAFETHFHLPGSKNLRTNETKRNSGRTEYTAAGLLALKTSGKITQVSYDKLTLPANANAFVAENIINPDKTRGYFVFKSAAASNKFYNYNKIDETFFAANSGITISFGYDMGGRTVSNYSSTNPNNHTNFLYITGLTPTADQAAIIKKAFGPGGTAYTSKHQAVAIFCTFMEPVFGLLTIDYDYAVSHITPFFKNDYISPGLGTNSGLLAGIGANVFKVYQSNGTPFYDTGSIQFMNEVEKLFFGTFLYNSGAKSLNANGLLGKYFIHAINTHDIRWMKALLTKKVKKKPTKPATYITTLYRRPLMHDFLDIKKVYDHYNIKQTTL